MPQLSSGRHVGISINPYLDALSCGRDESRFYAIVALRLNAATPEALRSHVAIVYFVDGAGMPPNAPLYYPGYTVADVLEGRSDLTEQEVTEFRAFLAEPRFEAWLQDRFREIDQAIRNNPVWSSELMQEGADEDALDVATLKRAAISKTVLEENAMAALRDWARKA
jgi:hypothetical protein